MLRDAQANPNPTASRPSGTLERRMAVANAKHPFWCRSTTTPKVLSCWHGVPDQLYVPHSPAAGAEPDAPWRGRFLKSAFVRYRRQILILTLTARRQRRSRHPRPLQSCQATDAGRSRFPPSFFGFQGRPVDPSAACRAPSISACEESILPGYLLRRQRRDQSVSVARAGFIRAFMRRLDDQACSMHRPLGHAEMRRWPLWVKNSPRSCWRRPCPTEQRLDGLVGPRVKLGFGAS